jgi:DNA-directed RNA polymerase specialized sigma24 family protein
MSNSFSGHEAEAVLTHLDWVRRLARSLVSDPGEAEELVQESWLAAARRPPRAGPLRGWLAEVVRNAARERARRESRRAGHASPSSLQSRTAPYQTLVRVPSFETI